MTGIQIKGKGFRGALRYNLAKVSNNLAEVLDHSFAEVSEKSIMREVQLIRSLRPNLLKYFYHTSINFPPQENLSNALMKQIGLDYLHANGFTEHQYILFRHYDASHPHLHILVNRINYEGKVLSDSNDYARSEKVLRDLEKKYKLSEVTSSRQAQERAATKDELEMMKRTNESSNKRKLQDIIKSVLNGNHRRTTGEFIAILRSNGVNVKFNQATTGFVSGISYDYKGLICKGAKLGNQFKWTTIKNQIDYDQDRDRKIILQANTQTHETTHQHQSSKRTSVNPSKIHFNKSSRSSQDSSISTVFSLDWLDLNRPLPDPAIHPQNMLPVRKRKKKRRRKL